MIRTAVPRPIRTGVALAGAVGTLALAGCGAAADDASADPPAHADGTYTASGTYSTPETVETIEVTVTLVDDVVTDVVVVGDPQRPETAQYQGQFIGGIADVVVGRDIDEISVSRVAGSSLTSAGFNQAIERIREEAAE
ncbi:FMN-binding protein [Microbacterium ulmi]|uniref:FMN-binding protein n=1 Tax=Microbacterium ulmi TaxID=179095 RepID=A0A7Y2Q060_9MICO|nr:FMN-binding protein [Microbacterium ulmi]NII68245.1 uncharacterized protein with FMN-binding domain [Microbacterium ulmi]NNH02278.1 FMN-binding protein [Microbacterium ulmi]